MTPRTLLRVWSTFALTVATVIGGKPGVDITMAILGVVYGSTEIVCRRLGAPGPLTELFRREPERLPRATVRR